jgi:hypothetical protein
VKVQERRRSCSRGRSRSKITGVLGEVGGTGEVDGVGAGVGLGSMSCR